MQYTDQGPQRVEILFQTKCNTLPLKSLKTYDVIASQHLYESMLTRKSRLLGVERSHNISLGLFN